MHLYSGTSLNHDSADFRLSGWLSSSTHARVICRGIGGGVSDRIKEGRPTTPPPPPPWPPSFLHPWIDPLSYPETVHCALRAVGLLHSLQKELLLWPWRMRTRHVLVTHAYGWHAYYTSKVSCPANPPTSAPQLCSYWPPLPGRYVYHCVYYRVKCIHMSQGI